MREASRSLSDTSENSDHCDLLAAGSKTGKMLYQSGNAIDTWVHFSGLALANGQVYAVDINSQVYCFGLKGK